MKLPSETIKEQEKLSSVSTVRRKSQIWFNDTYVNKDLEPREKNSTARLEVGKMYTYWYDPYYADKLAFFDNMPMMVCLGELETSKRVNAFGINISYLPPKWRVKIMDKIVQTFRKRYLNTNVDLIQKGRPSQQRTVPIFYDVAKQLLAGSGFEFALRSYRYDRFKSRPAIISYEDWWQPLLFPSSYIFKMNIKAIYAKYKLGLSDKAYKGIGSKDPYTRVKRTKVKDINQYIKEREK